MGVGPLPTDPSGGAGSAGGPAVSDKTVIFRVLDLLADKTSSAEDTITGVKNNLVVSTAEINKNNLLQEIANLQRQILQQPWPTDPAQQSQLIALLQADIDTAISSPAMPPNVQLATVADLTAVRDRDRQILDILQNPVVDADGNPRSAPLPAAGDDGSYALDQQVTEWVTSMGMTRPSDWTGAVVDNQFATREQLTRSWNFPVPGVLFGPLGYTYMATSDGAITLAQEVSKDDPAFVQAASAGQADYSFVNFGLGGFPSESDLQVLRVGDKYYVTLTEDAYARSPRGSYAEIPPDLPTNSDPSNPKVYWSDGVEIYSVDVISLRDVLISQVGAGTISAGSAGDDLVKFLKGTSRVFELAEAGLTDHDVKGLLPQLAQRSDAASTSTSQWKSIGETQRLQLQEALTYYNNLVTAMTSVLNRWERAWTSMLPGR